MVKVEELMGFFHCHYTIDYDDIITVSRLLKDNNIKFKLINIDLFRKDSSKIQRDIMCTIYLHTHKLKDSTTILREFERIAELIKSKVNLLRYKVEHTSAPSLPISEDNYFECHIELYTKTIEDYERAINELSNDLRLNNYKLSTNPRSILNNNEVLFFLNTRIFKENNEGDAFKEIASALKHITEKYKEYISLRSYKTEVVVFDSNKQHDKWWL